MTPTPSTAAREIADACLCRRSRSLSRRVTRLYDDALREIGLTANQLTVLVAVERAGELAPGTLGEQLEMERSTVSRTVARMVANGWLASAPEGGRRLWLSTTPAGRALVRDAHASWRRAQRQAGDLLGEALSAALLDDA